MAVPFPPFYIPGHLIRVVETLENPEQSPCPRPHTPGVDVSPEISLSRVSGSITLEGIETAVSNLNYRNPKILKYKYLQAVKSRYSEEDSIRQISRIDPDTLIREIWDLHDTPDAVRAKRKNLNSIRSTVNSDLKRLYETGDNPEGLSINPDNVFVMSDEVKNERLNAFSHSIHSDVGVDLEKISEVLNLINEFLSDHEGFKGVPDADQTIDNLKKILDTLKDMDLDTLPPPGIPDEDVEILDDDEFEEVEELEEDDTEILDQDDIDEAEDDDEILDEEELEEIEDDTEILDEDELEEIEDDAEIVDEDELEDIEEEEILDEDELEEIEDDDEILDEDELEEIEDDAEIVDEDELEDIEDDAEIIDEDELEDIGDDAEIIDGDELEDIGDDAEILDEDELEDIGDDAEILDEDELEEIEDDAEIIDEDELEDIGDDAEVIDEDELEDIEEDTEIIDEDELEEIEDEIDEIEDDTEILDEEELEDVEDDAEILDDDDLEDVEDDEILDEDELEDVEDDAEILDEDELEEIEDDAEIVDEDELEEIDEQSLQGSGLPDEGFGVPPTEDEQSRQLAEQFSKELGAMDRYYNSYLKIPQGQYLIGSPSPKKHELGEQTLWLPEFYMGKFPITNALFEVFVNATGYRTTAEKAGHGIVYCGRFRKTVDKKTGRIQATFRSSQSYDVVKGACWYQPEGPSSSIAHKLNHPVVQVSQPDAMAFAAWVGKRLPSEAEWEAAARTQKGYTYPWGNQWMLHACNLEDSAVSGTTPVDFFLDHINENHLADVLGNILEWTLDVIPSPYGSKKGTSYAIAKSASFISTPPVPLWSRQIFTQDYSSNIAGFRCAIQ